MEDRRYGGLEVQSCHRQPLDDHIFMEEMSLRHFSSLCARPLLPHPQLPLTFSFRIHHKSVSKLHFFSFAQRMQHSIAPLCLTGNDWHCQGQHFPAVAYLWHMSSQKFIHSKPLNAQPIFYQYSAPYKHDRFTMQSSQNAANCRAMQSIHAEKC